MTDAATASLRRGPAWRAAIGATAIAGTVAFAHLVRLPGLSMCTFKVLTGCPCPGCGMARAVTSLARGEAAAAFRFHPLAYALAAGAVALTAGGAWGVLTGRDPVWDWMRRRGNAIGIAFVASLVVLWIVRAFVVPSWSPDA